MTSPEIEQIEKLVELQTSSFCRGPDGSIMAEKRLGRKAKPEFSAGKAGCLALPFFPREARSHSTAKDRRIE